MCGVRGSLSHKLLREISSSPRRERYFFKLLYFIYSDVRESDSLRSVCGLKSRERGSVPLPDTRHAHSPRGVITTEPQPHTHGGAQKRGIRDPAPQKAKRERGKRPRRRVCVSRARTPHAVYISLYILRNTLSRISNQSDIYFSRIAIELALTHTHTSQDTSSQRCTYSLGPESPETDCSRPGLHTTRHL
jgi:hypothetical protein